MADPQRPLRLLSLDGGGIRGLSSLYILKQIMTQLEAQLGEAVSTPILPCDCFDLIAGTSTGGLIAVMLGTLQMDIDTCIREYKVMSPEIFPVGYRSGSKVAKFASVLTGTPVFDPISLERAVKRLVVEHLKDRVPEEVKKGMVPQKPQEESISTQGAPDTSKEMKRTSGRFRKLFGKTTQKDSATIQESQKTAEEDQLENTLFRYSASRDRRSPRCKVFVCATAQSIGRHCRFRSYQSPWDAIDDVPIWQACRATSAAPTFFPPMLIGDPPVPYVDGGLGYNNPIRPLMEEARQIWPNREISCIVSIGTGVPRFQAVGQKLVSLVKSLQAIATDVENTHRDFRHEKLLTFGTDQRIYFRFNVERGLEGVGLEEAEEVSKVQVATQDYARDKWDEITRCASQLRMPIVSRNDEYEGSLPPGTIRPQGLENDDKLVKDTRIDVRRPSILIPFERDVNQFVAREDIIFKICQLLAIHSRVALIGMSGVGVRSKSPETWVFWVHASNSARFHKSLCDIADRLALPGRNDPKADISSLVSAWLSDEGGSHWTMILDNADDEEIFFARGADPMSRGTNQPKAPPLSVYLPDTPRGKIIITSRYRAAAFRLAKQAERIIEVNLMEPADAKILLRKKLPDSEHSEEDLDSLVKALECLPLAITQAAAYIFVNSPSMTISRYLNLFNRDESFQIRLLSEDLGDSRRDDEVPSSVIKTWFISFDQIKRRDPRAVDLLSLMCIFDRQGIPRRILCSGGDDVLDFEAALGKLNGFSLIKPEKQGDSFEMHRLVQLSTKRWLATNGEVETWVEKALVRLSDCFPFATYENRESCTTLLPHVSAILAYDHKGRQCLLQRAQVLYKVAMFLLTIGNYQLAGIRGEEALVLTKALLGKEDPFTLNTSTLVAKAYGSQGRWKEAEELEVEVLETQKRLFRLEHPSTLKSMHSLASTYWAQGRLKEAGELGAEVVEKRKRVLGIEHPDTLMSIHNLALAYQIQGRWKEAEELGAEVVEKRKRVLGIEHLDTLMSIQNLASTYQSQGRWEEAEELGAEVTEARNRLLEIEHPNTLASMHNLALTYWGQGQWKEAEKLGAKVVEARKRVLGIEHPDTLMSIHSLSLTYQSQGRWKEAEELGAEVVENRKKVLGIEHPATLASIHHLALTYWGQGQWKEAEKLGAKVVEARKRVLGIEHPDTLMSIHGLVPTYQSQGRWKEAEELGAEVVEKMEKVLGVEHLDTLASMHNLALTYWGQGQWKEAEKLGAKVVEARKRVLGIEHPCTLMSIHNLVPTYWSQGRWKEAEELGAEVVEKRKEVLGIEHPDTLASMHNLAFTYQSQGRWKEAEKLGVKAVEARKRVLGIEHPNTLASMHNLALAYRGQGRWKEAEELGAGVVEKRKRVLGPEHPSTLLSIYNLAGTWKSQGRIEEAIGLMERVDRLRRERLGPSHPDTISSTNTLRWWRTLEEAAKAAGVPRSPDPGD
ncbi:hypothetical protein FGG08_001132 [Glutinoglossum americanum]|uniref:PNPLA domain-containing protein n=1 Tax=Glutinoglossum americanum TaxID=1670608 RepID=A0A9P8IBP6_9PEZI|nr:hypothetical protein FGG08_001132 [Glutinoglossum americanum]